MKRKNYYRSGRIAEGKAAKRLKRLGFRSIRLSNGSRGPADIYAVIYKSPKCF